VKDFTVTRRGGVIYRKDAYLSTAARRFIEILKATAKEIAVEKRRSLLARDETRD
jgi:hypothetical protein